MNGEPADSLAVDSVAAGDLAAGGLAARDLAAGDLAAGGPAQIRALAITVSNRASAGVYEDKSGPVLTELLRAAGCSVDGPLVVPDGEAVEAALREAIVARYDVVVTTGGTGLTPGDRTPEMTRRVLGPGITGGAGGGKVPRPRARLP